MRLNKWLFEEHTLYTYGEVIAMPTFPTNPSQFSKEWMFAHLQYWTMLIIQNNTIKNPFSLSFIDSDGSITASSIGDNALILFNKLISRYTTHFALDCTKDQDVRVQATLYMRKVFNKLDYTYLKYSTLIDMYNTQKEHLLDKLQRTRSGSRQLSQSGTTTGSHTGSSTGTEAGNYLDLHNDTPQTTDVVATMSGNQYVSDLKKGNNSSETHSNDTASDSGTSSSTGTDEFSETENWDTMTIMARLDEIEKQFSNIWNKWLNEFDELFIEEVNY